MIMKRGKFCVSYATNLSLAKLPPCTALLLSFLLKEFDLVTVVFVVGIAHSNERGEASRRRKAVIFMVL